MRYLLCICLCYLSHPVLAKSIYFGRGEVKITVPFSDTDGDLISEPITVVFPQEVKAVKNKSLFIIRPEDKSAPDYRRLNIIPMMKSGAQRISFTMIDGLTIKVKARIVKRREVLDSEIKFLPRASLEKKNSHKLRLTDLDILRARLGEKNLLGFKTIKLRKKLNCGVWNLVSRLVRVDKNDKSKVYQIELSSRSNKFKYKILQEKIYFEDQDLNRSIISNVTNDLLIPKRYGNNKSVLTIVTGPETTIRKSHLCKVGEQIIQSKFIVPVSEIKEAGL